MTLESSSGMKVGEFVTYSSGSGRSLRSGSETYSRAVVISVDPLIAVSEGADMRWCSTLAPEHMEVVGVAPQEVLEKCMSRLPG
jgi:hypothetical protein